MSLTVFKCENCGARVPPPPSTVKMVVCEFCSNPGLNPFYVATTEKAPAPQAAAPQGPTRHAPAPQAPVAQPARTRSADDIARLAHSHLQVFDSLYYAPAIPAAKEQGAREGYGALIPASEPILALYDATVFGGADDGFVVTPNLLGWKNIAAEPHVVPWQSFDPRSVRASESAVAVMGDEIQVPSSDALQARLVQFLYAMGGAAQAPVAQAQPATQRARDEPEDNEEGDEEPDEETVQEWIDDTLAMAEEHFRERASLHLGPGIPGGKERVARRAHADSLEDDDTIVVLYDPAGGGNDDGFIATPWGLFWKNRGEEPLAVWWEELDHDAVELDDGALFIDGDEVRINDQDRGLADELYAFITAMIDWAS